MKKLSILGLLLFSVAAQSLHAGEGIDSLNAFFNEVRTLRADFVQYRTDQENRVVQESSGVLLLEKPGKVRLEYKLPYEQLYVADGDRIWSYDPDLEQAIVKQLDAAIGDTPILLLSGHSDLDKSFTTRELEQGKDRHTLYWVELTPKKAESAFEKVRIAFTRKDRELRIMELEDALGYSTFIQFKNVERNITHGFNAFNFTPPKGVDVIRDLPAEQ
ncbi:MAG: outer membrane lipoprotein chaperone LolA [Gammaproteobacteria bacterium]|nr:outer membrane lipoprotein chaperone LolA [Gammaproteobacteria bacterium]